MRPLGRALQLLGLVVLPAGMLLQLMNQITLRDLLVLLVAGVSAFWLGRMLEGYAAH
jgi:hypothetical protein